MRHWRAESGGLCCGIIDAGDVYQQREARRSSKRERANSKQQGSAAVASSSGALDSAECGVDKGGTKAPLLSGTVVDAAVQDEAWGIGAPAPRWFSWLPWPK